ncbi:helix-turn-helix transcriptional regulator [Nocardioides sp. YJ-D4]
MNRVRLAEFLRTRREALQPEDVGLPRGSHRRTPGLRRDEVAELSGISTHYYTRIEQPRGPVPSAQVLAAIARGLRLSSDELDHLLRLAGHPAVRPADPRHGISPGLRRIFDRLQDETALIVDEVGETLLQTPAAVALLGDETRYSGMMRSRIYRWFTDPTSRRRTPTEDHPAHSRALVAQLAHAAASTRNPRADAMIAALRRSSPEFEELWSRHPVAGPYCDAKRLIHDEVGEIELHGQTLHDPERPQALTVFTAEPGSESERRLRMLSRV